MRLMRIKDENGLVLQGAATLLRSLPRITVANRRREIARLKRRPHPGMFGDRHAPREDECFCSAADSAIERANEHVAIADVGQTLVADFPRPGATTQKALASVATPTLCAQLQCESEPRCACVCCSLAPPARSSSPVWRR